LKKIYIAGPMTGYKLFNYPEFDETQYGLEKRYGDKIEVVNPAGLTRTKLNFDPETLPSNWDWRVMPPGVNLDAVIDMDIEAIRGCDGIVLLNGWEMSTGASAEAGFARWRRMPTFLYNANGLLELDKFINASESFDSIIDSDFVKQARGNPENRGVVGGKPTNTENPKDAIGSGKLPIHLWPASATMMGCIGLLNGMLKYGRSNWRVAGIRASIYYSALMRHMHAWFEGEDIDPDDDVPHLAAALACLAIVVDADAAGKLNDDRHVFGGYRKIRDNLSQYVAKLKEKHADKDPYHYTIADNNDYLLTEDEEEGKLQYIFSLVGKDGDLIDSTAINENNPELARELMEGFVHNEYPPGDMPDLEGSKIELVGVEKMQ
jgi:nucleoside 2-deoxyribosyltransferase